MSIAFDASSSGAGDTDTLTVSHTCTGTELLLVVGAMIDDFGGSITATATYNGTSMTNAKTFLGSDDTKIFLFYLINPDTGANNIVVEFSDSDDCGLMACSYTGVNQVSPLDSTGSRNDSASPFNISLATSYANDLMVGVFADDDDTANARTASAGTNERKDVLLGSGAGDFGGFFGDRICGAPGTYTVGYTDGDVSISQAAAATFKEHVAVAASNIKTFDGTARANIKTIDGVSIANIKTLNGISNA